MPGFDARYDQLLKERSDLQFLMPLGYANHADLVAWESDFHALLQELIVWYRLNPEA